MMKMFIKKTFLMMSVVVLCACQSDKQTTPTTQNPTNKIILTPDWGIAGILTAIGNPPVATGDLRSYPEWSLKPALPPETIDLGARFQPNPELLAQLHYDAVIDNDFYQHLRGQYGDKPILSFSSGVEVGKSATWQQYVDETKKIAEFVGKSANAEHYIAQSEKQLAMFAQQFANQHPTIKKVAIVQFSSSNHIRHYTQNSLFQPALERMGIAMYVHGEGNMWGSMDMALTDLAKIPNDVCLVVIEPFSVMLQKELQNNALWQRMGYQDGKRCMMILPPIWLFGGLPSIMAFSEFLATAKLANVKDNKNE